MSDVTIKMSPTVGAIAGALAKAQLAMKPAVKDSTNPHFKNRYASLVSCVEAVRPLQEAGIAVLQPPAVQSAEGVTVSTLLVHSSGEWICGELYMPASKKDAQGFGSALSYARRYCLSSTVGMATDDDDGEAAVRSESRRDPPKESEPTDDERRIARLFGEAKTTDDIAKAEAEAHRALQAKKVVNGGRERLLKLHRAAVERVSP